MLKEWRFRAMLLAGLGLLAGCANYQAPTRTVINTDYRLQILQSFDQLANGSYLDFQQGQRITSGNLDRWTAYCRLYIYNPDQSADYRTAIIPGTLQIDAVKAVYQSSDYPFQPGFGQLSWGVRDLPAFYLYQVGMRLSATDQPDVRSLVCYKKWATPRALQYPTLAEIRNALGDYFRLVAQN